MDINQFTGDSTAAPVLTALAAAKWRKARDLAKELCKKERARYLPLLIEANVGLVREMKSKGLTQDAEPVLAYLKSICPSDMWEKLRQDLEKAAPVVVSAPTRDAPASGSPAVVLALAWPTVLKAAEACEKGLPVSAAEWAAVDAAVSAFTPAPTGDGESLGLLVAAELEMIHLACAATAEGRWEDAQTGLRSLARQSVFLHWRMFLRGVRHHFLREAEQARRCFGTLPPDGALARAAAVIAGNEVAPDLKRQAPSRARADWWLAVSGQPRTLAAALTEAHVAWVKPDVRQSFEVLGKAFGKDFPSLQPSLAGLMTAVIMPTRIPRGAVEEKRANQWNHLQQDLLRQKNLSQLICAMLRALALRDTAVMNPHDLFEEWRQMLNLQIKILGPNPVRDSIGWLWLGEQMMKPPPSLGFFTRQESPHRHAGHARTALLEATVCDDSHEAAWLALLRFHTERGETSERNKLLDDLVKCFPQNKDVLIQTGLLAAERKAFTKALPSLRAARALDPLDRQAQTALVTALIQQARELLKKQRPADAVWAEIETLTHEAAGPVYHTLARWTQRVRRAVLERSDALAAEAAAMAPTVTHALFFERLLSPLYKCELRAGWQQAWSVALETGSSWQDLISLLEIAHDACRIKGFGWQEARLVGNLLEAVLTRTASRHLLDDPDGMLLFITRTSTHSLPDKDYQWLGTTFNELRAQLTRALAPYSKKQASHPHQCFAGMQLQLDHFAWQPEKTFDKRLAEILSIAQKQGLTVLLEAAQLLRSQLDQGPDGAFDGGFDDDFEEESFPPLPPIKDEQITEADFNKVPPAVMLLLLELGDAIIEGDTAAIARLRLQSIAGGMSAELFDKFVRCAPTTGSKPGDKQKKSSRKGPQPELDLF
ncbi:MAG: tetratricopeptide repeat protein [Prosthecobacter sp.]